MKKHNLSADTSLSISEVSKLTKIPRSILQEVYNRGIGAYKTNITSVRLKSDFSKNPNPNIPASDRLSKEQWAMARVYSFVQKGTTYKTADSDLAEKIKF